MPRRAASPPAHVIVPQWSVVSPAPDVSSRIAVGAVMARITIDGARATPDLKIALDNLSREFAEAVLLVPVSSNPRLPLGSTFTTGRFDVNAPLLDLVADASRGSSVFCAA